MKVKKLLKGLLAAALAVTMAVTPAASVKAAEVTVTSGASTYTFSETPIAAFEVTGFRANDEEWSPFILFCVPRDTFIRSQAGSSSWDSTLWTNGIGPTKFFDEPGGESEEQFNKTVQHNKQYPDNRNGVECGEVYVSSQYFDTETYEWVNGEYVMLAFIAIYHRDIPGNDTIKVVEISNSDKISLIPEAFAGVGATAVQIPVEDALAKDNANIQSNAAAQTQITAQQQSVSQGTYTVEAGDNLCKIAQKVYGDAKAWREIYKANSSVVKSNYIIYKGQVLTIPAK